MPAKIYTDVPSGDGHWGEQQLVTRLVELGNDRTHLWAGVDYLPGGVPDIDLVLIQADLACFNIEIKGIPIDAIERYGLDVCDIRGRSTSHHPVKQAGVAQIGLRNYFPTVSNVRCPYLFATAAFPRIRRKDMVARFDGQPLLLQFEGMIFEEDLVDEHALQARLQRITQQPPRGLPPRHPLPEQRQLDAAIRVLDPGARKVAASRSDRARGATIAENVGRPGARPSSSGPAAKYLQPGQARKVVFRGAAGTGKTVQLQEIAVAHARAGRAVLFTCYNRVLASTLRHILSTQQLGEAVDKRIVVAHVDELRKQLGDSIESFTGLFGTICIDEAQDMEQVSFEFLCELASPDGEWFLADGHGQELYSHRSDFVAKAREQGTVETLRRNFRNSSAGFLVAQATYEHAPDEAAIPDWTARRPLRAAKQPTPDALFELPQSDDGGHLPRVVRVDRSGPDWRKKRLNAYTAVIFAELEKLAEEGNSRDLAILCAEGDQKSEEAGVARQALQLLGVPVHDQIEVGGRDRPVEEGQVRLVTIHSSRGIEASRVVVLGMATGISQDPRHQTNSRVMSYIALSRAQTATTVIAPDNVANTFVDFIESLVATYRATDEGPEPGTGK